MIPKSGHRFSDKIMLKQKADSRAVTCAKRADGRSWCLHIADFPRYFYDFRGVG
jgi:hypothetical protein